MLDFVCVSYTVLTVGVFQAEQLYEHCRYDIIRVIELFCGLLFGKKVLQRTDVRRR